MGGWATLWKVYWINTLKIQCGNLGVVTQLWFKVLPISLSIDMLISLIYLLYNAYVISKQLIVSDKDIRLQLNKNLRNLKLFRSIAFWNYSVLYKIQIYA